MVNWRLIAKILGSLLCIEAFIMTWCVAMSFAFHEDDLLPFLLSTLLTFGAGCVALLFGRKSAGAALSRRDAYVVVAAAWTVFSLFGMTPFLLHGSLTSVTDAFFETMSGFSTTGATLIDNVEALPHGLLFWRSLTQWIGGLGIVFFTIAVLPSMTGGSVKVFAAEATGPMRSKMHPRLSTSAKWIWSIYVLLTAVCGVSFWAAGMDWFDATNYSMSTTATGGFSTHNGSTVFFHSATIEYLAILFQFLAGVNFTLLYVSLFHFRFGQLLRNSEFKLYTLLTLAATALIMYLLITESGYDWESALRSSLFQVVSFITTTGLSNDDAGFWPPLAWVVLMFLMLIGASAGSTTGGFKCARALMLFKVLRNEFRRLLHPNAVLPVKMNEQSIPQARLLSVSSFFALYMVMLILAAAVMMAGGIDPTNAITIALSLISNVGAGLDTNVGPQMSWADLSDGLKWTCSALMLVGRLEIISVLVLFTRSFWKEN